MKNIAYLLVIAIFSIAGCSSTVKSDNNIDAEQISIVRFDKDIYNYLQDPGQDKETRLKENYPFLLPAFGRIAMENSDPETYFSSLRDYFSHPMLIQIYKDALQKFDDVTSYEGELSAVNNLISANFPGRRLPQLAMHVSGFRENVIILNNLISISTDKYLGIGYPTYHEFFRPYEQQQMQPQYITRDYIRAWLMSDVVKSNSDEENLLSSMITEGKILYALSILFSQQNSEYIIGYTPAQTAWCKQNEKMVWEKIVKQNHLFSSDHMIITRYINDAANTSTVSQDSPGRLGCWVGWQIVSQYAKKKGASLEEIINVDARVILKEAKYNP